VIPYYEQDGVTIYHGEASRVLERLEPGSCDVLCTDPPYSSGGLFRGDRAKDAVDKYIRTESDRGRWLTFSGDSRDQLSFLHWVAVWSYLGTRVVKPGGHAFCFSDWRQVPTVSNALQIGGWTWRGLLAWEKPNGGLPQRGRFRQNVEFIAWGTNGIMEDKTGAIPEAAICRVAVPTAKIHPTEKPELLLGEILRVVPGERLTIVDPFMGSGTTLVAAKLLGHRAIGIELEEVNCERAALRLRQGALFTAEEGG
jgi:site-specific DNA-methyltransferase (adenine-specific)